MASSGQKFIGRNRAPRVQIEYDVETYGSEKKVQLPFVMGVMSDLLGAQETPPPKIEDRKFIEFDHDNFESRMSAMAPRYAANVANKLTGKGLMAVDLKFHSMDDFGPAAIARNVEPLKKLLEARQRLSDLIAYMDGRADAETLVGELLHNPEKLQQLVATLGAQASSEDDNDERPTDAAQNTPSDQSPNSPSETE